MRARPIRSRIYLPVLKLGLVATDWKYVGGITMLTYVGLYPTGWKVWSVPVFMLAGILVAALSYFFFYFTRVGRRSHWLEHTFRAWRESPIRRRHLPIDHPLGGYRPWIISDEEPE